MDGPGVFRFCASLLRYCRLRLVVGLSPLVAKVAPSGKEHVYTLCSWLLVKTFRVKCRGTAPSVSDGFALCVLLISDLLGSATLYVLMYTINDAILTVVSKEEARRSVVSTIVIRDSFFDQKSRPLGETKIKARMKTKKI